MKVPPSARIAAVLLAVALLAAACGSEDEPGAGIQSTGANVETPATSAADDAALEQARDEADATDAEAQATAEAQSPTTTAAPTTTASPTTTTAATTTAAPVIETGVPAQDMIDVRTGATVNLRDFVDGSTPLLLWFWAPH